MRCEDCSLGRGCYSDYYRAFLCDDCFDQRCFDEGEPITLEDLEDINDQIVCFERLQ